MGRTSIDQVKEHVCTWQAFTFRPHPSKVHQSIVDAFVGLAVANQMRVRREERQTCSRPSFPQLHCTALHCTAMHTALHDARLESLRLGSTRQSLLAVAIA
jgi:hypothetical protein